MWVYFERKQEKAQCYCVWYKSLELVHVVVRKC